MDGDLVFQSDNPQDSSSKLLSPTPESPPIAFLPLHSDGILQNLNAPLLLKIGPFTQYFILKIRGVPVLDHKKNIPLSSQKSEEILSRSFGLSSMKSTRIAVHPAFGSPYMKPNPIAEGGMRFTFPPYGPFSPLYSRSL